MDKITDVLGHLSCLYLDDLEEAIFKSSSPYDDKCPSIRSSNKSYVRTVKVKEKSPFPDENYLSKRSHNLNHYISKNALQPTEYFWP